VNESGRGSELDPDLREPCYKIKQLAKPSRDLIYQQKVQKIAGPLPLLRKKSTSQSPAKKSPVSELELTEETSNSRSKDGRCTKGAGREVVPNVRINNNQRGTVEEETNKGVVNLGGGSGRRIMGGLLLLGNSSRSGKCALNGRRTALVVW